MKSFKQIAEEVINEGGEMYPADEMTMNEVKIACYAARNILDRLESGYMIQRWQISAIVKASEELASVYTSMSANEHDDEIKDEEEWLSGYDDDEAEGEYVGYEYPSMYGEEVELKEGNKNIISDRDLEKLVKSKAAVYWKSDGFNKLPNDKFFYIPILDKTKKMIGVYKASTSGSDQEYEYLDSMLKDLKEEADYKVSVDGLPDIYVKANNPSEVKTNLRKIVKNPEMIRSVDRVTQSVLKNIFRDKAAGKEEQEAPEKSSKSNVKPSSKS